MKRPRLGRVKRRGLATEEDASAQMPRGLGGRRGGPKIVGPARGMGGRFKGRAMGGGR